MKKYSGSGSPFVRGGMDSYYHRPRNPHYYIDGTNEFGHQCQIRIEKLTEEETEQYFAGYEDNEENGDKKDWG
jgi:hypothetical protein